MTGVFIDTNVLVFASRAASQFHQIAAASLARLEDGGSELCLSRQVVREFLATITRPQADADAITGPAASVQARRLLDIYEMLEDAPSITARLLILMDTVPIGGKQVHDANIVATMLAHGITRLLTFNASDFRRFGDLIELVAP